MFSTAIHSLNRILSAPPRTERTDADKALYIAGLIGTLVNRAAEVGHFRAAIPAHAQMNVTEVGFRCDEGHRSDLGLTALATATEAEINVQDTDAHRLGFLAFNPIHKQSHGFDPLWEFDRPDTAMTTRCQIIGVALEVRCHDHDDGSATIALQLAA